MFDFILPQIIKQIMRAVHCTTCTSVVKNIKIAQFGANFVKYFNHHWQNIHFLICIIMFTSSDKKL